MADDDEYIVSIEAAKQRRWLERYEAAQYEILRKTWRVLEEHDLEIHDFLDLSFSAALVNAERLARSKIDQSIKANRLKALDEAMNEFGRALDRAVDQHRKTLENISKSVARNTEG